MPGLIPAGEEPRFLLMYFSVMKKAFLTLLLVVIGASAEARAGTTIHVSIGGGGFGYHGYGSYCGHYYCYAPRYYAPIFYGGYYYGYPGAYYDTSDYAVYPTYPVPDSGVAPPTPAPPAPTAAAPATAPASQAAPKQAPNQIPYGFDIGTKLIKSPWSGFVINGAAKAPEQVVYDANTGQAFRIPPSP